MDEPFGALDEFTRNKLDDDLVRLWWERKLTTVFVTHSIYEAVFLSTRIIVMAANPGRIFRTMTIDQPQPRDRGISRQPEIRRLLPRIVDLARRGLAAVRRDRCAWKCIVKPLLESETFVRIAAPVAVGIVLCGVVGGRLPAGVGSGLSVSQAERHLRKPHAERSRR